MKTEAPRGPLHHAFLPWLGQGQGQERSFSSFFQVFSEYSLIRELQRELGYSFKNPKHLLEALTHKTFAHECSSFDLPHNEKLEFLGDSILGAVISSELYRRFPDLKEGDFSKLRGAIVNEKKLSELARGLKLYDLLLLGKGEVKNQGMHRDSLLADAFEALIGALSLDAGFTETYQAIVSLLNKYPGVFTLSHLESFDFKSKLQEITMASLNTLPQYHFEKITEQGGEQFKVTLSIKGIQVGSTVNPSKKKAEKRLAQEFFAQDNWEQTLKEIGEDHHAS